MNKEEIINKLKYYLNFEAMQINKIEVIEIINLIKDIEKQNKKYKEVINRLKKHCEIEINASNHHLENHSSQKELCHKVAHQRILDILKEVE